VGVSDLRQEIIEKIAHEFAFSPVHFRDLPDMGIEIVSHKVTVEYLLGEEIRVEVSRLLDDIELCDDLFRCIDPPDPHTRSNDLGEGSRESGLVGKEMLYRKPGFCVKEELSKGVILVKYRVGLPQDLCNRPAVLLGIGPSRRVLGIGDPVEKFQRFCLHECLKCRKVQTVIIEGNGMDHGLIE
jgi:hypothetical protein